MSAFHPAVAGILYGALAQHEQALIQMALAANIAHADVDDEIAERYGAIVDGLKRLIAATEPSRPGARSGIEAAERMRRAYVLLGDLQTQLSDFDIWSWDCRADEIGASLRDDRSGNETARANMRAVAERIGVDYVEKRHGSTGDTLIVCAKGEIDGIAVRIYDLIEAERPICDTHHVMVDAAGVCPECPEAVAEGQLLTQLRRVHAAELYIDMQVCAACSEKHGTSVRWPCAPLKQFEVELGGPEVRAEVRRTHFGKKDPEHGRVCVGCSEEQGVPILWPCLLLRAVDRIEDVPSADAGLVSSTPPAGTETAAAEEPEVNDSAYDYDLRDTHALKPHGGDVALCGAIGGRTSPIDADVSCYGCLAVLAAPETDTTSTEPPGDVL